MAQAQLLLKNGHVVLPDRGTIPADIEVHEGKIRKICAPGESLGADEVVDVKGLHILPGAIDVHLHLGSGMDISRPRKPSDAASETAAAALGGVTTFIPYLMGTEDYASTFDEVVSVTEEGARIDFGYHLIIANEDQLRAVPNYARDLGVSSFKYFMNMRGGEGDRLGLPPTDDGFMYRLLQAVGDVGGIVCPHPENVEVTWALRAQVEEAGTEGLPAWNATRPPMVEAEAIRRICYFARQVGVPVYCVHTSSGEALKAALAERAEGGQVFIETCNHYLTHDNTSAIGDLGKINPPLRDPGNPDALWRALAQGQIDTLGTDHVHRPASAKQGGIWKASPGTPGLDTYLPVQVSWGYWQHGLSLERIAQFTSTRPAQIMGLAETKGRIAVGMDADLAIVDLEKKWVLDAGNLASDAGYSIYQGETFKGAVIHTIARGRFALRDGAINDDAIGKGRYLRRKLGVN